MRNKGCQGKITQHQVGNWRDGGAPSGIYKINWDVGIDEKKNRLGVGIIICDSSQERLLQQGV